MPTSRRMLTTASDPPWLALLDDPADAALLHALLLDDGTHDARAVAPAATAKRRRRRRVTPKTELERLRTAVADLEGQAALLTHRRASSVPSGAHPRTSSRAAVTVWRSAAARQFELLRESQREHERLCAQLQRQRSLMEGFTRAIQRAQLGLPATALPREPVYVYEGQLARKREELLLKVSSVFQFLRSTGVQSLQAWGNDEFRDTESSIRPDKPNVPPGTLLARSRAKRFVEAERQSFCDRHWRHSQDMYTSTDRYSLQHVDHTDHYFFIAFSTELPQARGSGLFHSVGLRARFRTNGQEVIVSAGSLWPDAAAPPHLQHSGFDLTTWTLTQSHTGSTEVNEVVMNIECSRAMLPPSSPRLTSHQVDQLQAIVVGAHNFLLDQNDQYVDAYMLKQGRQE